MNREKICAYCRVSTKDKEQLSSFDNQMSYFQREFGGNETYELVRLYADCGRSGTSLKRPDFDKMIADAGIDKSKMDGDLFLITGKPKFTRILVKNTSRFARNVSSDMLLKTLTKNGVYVDFIDTHLSTERAADIMTLQVLQVLDENESRQPCGARTVYKGRRGVSPKLSRRQH
jgi:site-specific DNA recombinase